MVDAKTAQDALALAIRLQQEKGSEVSLEELHRTADEAGIDRVYLDRALHQVSRKSRLASWFLSHPWSIVAMTVALAYSILIGYTVFSWGLQSGEWTKVFLTAFVSGALGLWLVLHARQPGFVQRHRNPQD